MVRRFFKDILPWMLLVTFFVLGVAMAIAIGREVRRGASRPVPAVSSSASEAVSE
jgi:hypothetical protein